MSHNKAVQTIVAYNLSVKSNQNVESKRKPLQQPTRLNGPPYFLWV